MCFRPDCTTRPTGGSKQPRLVEEQQLTSDDSSIEGAPHYREAYLEPKVVQGAGLEACSKHVWQTLLWNESRQPIGFADKIVYSILVDQLDEGRKTARIEGTLHKPSYVPEEGYCLRKPRRKATAMRNHISKGGKIVRRGMTTDAVPLSPSGPDNIGADAVESDSSGRIGSASDSAEFPNSGRFPVSPSSRSQTSIVHSASDSSSTLSLARSMILPSVEQYSTAPRSPAHKKYVTTSRVLEEQYVDPELKARRVLEVLRVEPKQRGRRITAPAALTPYSEDHFSPRCRKLCREEVDRKMRSKVLDYHDRERYRMRAVSYLLLGDLSGEQPSLDSTYSMESVSRPLAPILVRGVSYKPPRTLKNCITQCFRSLISALACGKRSKTLA